MTAFQFFKTVTADKANLVERLLKVLGDNNIRFCVIGGLAVGAYVEPLVSLDFDLVVATYQLGRFESLLASAFIVNRTPGIIHITAQGSDVRANVYSQTRYGEFVERATMRPVLGMTLPVATMDDVLTGKLWAVQDTTRSAIKRQKDLLDIARLLQKYPKLVNQVPPPVLAQLRSAGA